MKKQVTILLTIISIVYTCQGQSNFLDKKHDELEKINSVISQNWNGEITTNKYLPYSYVTAYPNDSCMYYWDTYFINKGLIATKQIKLAKQNTLNLLNVVSKLGFVANASITSWGMNRSQPPYLSMMVRDVYEADRDVQFLREAYPLLKMEYHFWTDNGSSVIEDHHTDIEGLQRFSHHATKEDLISFYNYLSGRLPMEMDISAGQKILIASDYTAEAETGMDFTPRFENHCTQFIAVDLNCLLYCLENNLEWMCHELKLSDQANWSKLAQKRKTLINRYCWDEKSGMYYDFNFVTHKKSEVAAVTTFQPLWAGIASVHQARKVLGNIQLFETPYGLTTTVKGSNDQKYQWGSNSIWAPMQLIAVEGMRRYGFNKEANKTAINFMGLIAKNYASPSSTKTDLPVKRKPGVTYEKYKSDGTINDDEYIANIMMGWTAGVYNCLYQMVYNSK